MEKSRRSPISVALVVLGMGVVACLLSGVSPAAADVPAASVPPRVASVAVPGGATAVAVQGNVIATAGGSGSSVSIIDLPSLTVRSTTVLPLTPQEVVLSPDGALAYILAGKIEYDRQVFGGIFVVDTATGVLVRSAVYDKVQGKGCGGVMTMSGLAISPNGSRLSIATYGCSQNAEIWSIDPVTLVVGDKAVTWQWSGSTIGIPSYGPLVATDERTFAMGWQAVWKCEDGDGCPQPDRILTVSGGTASVLSSGPAAVAKSLARDPADGALLALTPLTKWVQYDPLPAAQSLIRVDPTSGAQLLRIDGLGSDVVALTVDPSTRLVYGLRESGKSMVVVDAVAGAVLGELPVAANAHSVGVAFLGGRGYVATGAGIDVIEPGQMLAPSIPQGVQVKVGGAVRGKVQATVTWKAPAKAGTSAITGYRVEALARNSVQFDRDDGRPTDQQTCSTRRNSCMLTLKQVKTTDDLYPALYTFTVTPLSKNGDGVSAFVYARPSVK